MIGYTGTTITVDDTGRRSISITFSISLPHPDHPEHQVNYTESLELDPSYWKMLRDDVQRLLDGTEGLVLKYKDRG